MRLRGLLVKLITVCVTAHSSLLMGQLRATSAPYLSGDTFRNFANHLYDETSRIFDPNKVQYGDVIFVKGDLLGRFFEEKHPYIQSPYVLLCHNSDEAMPGEYGDFLEDPKILAWFAQNVEEYSHPKLIPIPIGLANRYWAHGNIDAVRKIQMMQPMAKNHLLYLNISVSNFPTERKRVYDLMVDKNYCYASTPKPFLKFLKDLALSKFVLSPRGNGIDCHRTWEALYMGAIPIVRSSHLDPLYENLPVLIVNEWEEINEEFLEQKYQEMSSQKYNLEKLDASYWYKKITAFKKSNPHFDPKDKKRYYFSLEPVDVVIPCVEKDLEVLRTCIRSVRNYYKGVRRIIVLSPKKLTNEAEWFDEAHFPFTKKDVAIHLLKSEEAGLAYLQKKDSRFGWYYQQLLKLYAPLVIPDISSNVLILDADVVFLNPISFQNVNGAPVFNVGGEYHYQYFDHMGRFIPGLEKKFPEFSGISHCMLFQRSIINELFKTVEAIHQCDLWKAFCLCTDLAEVDAAGASEYEIYFNFALTTSRQAKINPLKVMNVSSIENLNSYKKAGFSYVVSHDHIRKPSKVKR